MLRVALALACLAQLSRGQSLDEIADAAQDVLCALFKVRCRSTSVAVVDASSFEARLTLDCSPASEEDFLQDYGYCYDKLRRDAALLRRSSGTPGNPLLGWGPYRWVGSITWTGENALYQQYRDTQLNARWGYWLARNFQPYDCNPEGSTGSTCRRAAVCRITTETACRSTRYSTGRG